MLLKGVNTKVVIKSNNTQGKNFQTTRIVSTSNWRFFKVIILFYFLAQQIPLYF